MGHVTPETPRPCYQGDSDSFPSWKSWDPINLDWEPIQYSVRSHTSMICPAWKNFSASYVWMAMVKMGGSAVSRKLSAVRRCLATKQLASMVSKTATPVKFFWWISSGGYETTRPHNRGAAFSLDWRSPNWEDVSFAAKSSWYQSSFQNI